MQVTRGAWILISRLLLCMRGMYVTSIHLDFHWNTQNTICSRAFGPPITHNLITHIWTFHHSQSDHGWFWLSVTWNLWKAQQWSKSILTFDRCHLPSLTFGYSLAFYFLCLKALIHEYKTKEIENQLRLTF